ncbi:MAG: class I SAM-dependent methyltransferase [Bacteroidales bacterium]|jgi:hypothetical protein
MNLCDTLAIECKTDKSSLFHNYTEIYERYFRGKRKEIKSLLEVGVWHGESLVLWKNYFPNAKIVGVDITPDCKQYEDDRAKVVIADATKQLQFPMYIYEWLTRTSVSLAQSNNPVEFDIIIDDGSHHCAHVIATFELLFKHVKPGGWYIVEDTSCSYFPHFGGGLREPKTTVEYFKNLIDEVNFMGYKGETYASRREYLLAQGEKNKMPFSYWTKNIKSIQFYNGLIFIEKV